MTGPEHYREAEQAIAASTWQRQEWGNSGNDLDTQTAALQAASWEMQRAQVHATLAHAAAFACARLGELPAWDADAWLATAAAPSPGREPARHADAAPAMPDVWHSYTCAACQATIARGGEQAEVSCPGCGQPMELLGKHALPADVKPAVLR